VFIAKAQSYSDNELICFIKHLKSVNKLEADYLEHIVTEPLPDFNCDKVVAEFIEEYYCEKRSELVDRLEITDEKFNECFLPKLKEADAANDQMQLIVLSELTTLTAEEKNTKRSNIGKNDGMLLVKTLKACDLFPVAVEYFIKLMYPPMFFNAVNKTEEYLYCLRKYVVEKKLIDTNVFNVTLNPTNLDTANVNCEEVFDVNAEMEIVMPTMSGSVETDHYRACSMKKLHTLSNYEQNLRAFVLNELHISEEEMKAERESYFNFIRKMNLAECFD
jgi:hypothetical protein